MRNIAKVVGVTPMAIYRYFDDKDDLQKQLLKSAFELIGSYLHTSLEGKNAEQRLMLSAQDFLRFALNIHVFSNSCFCQSIRLIV